MKERSLVAFTLLAQMAVGAFWTLVALRLWAARALADAALPVVPLLMGLALLASFFHLGSPGRAWRALANQRSSWVSREILLAVLFGAASALLAAPGWLKLGDYAAGNGVAWAAALLGLLLIYSMAAAYRLRTIPAWDTPATSASFLVTTCLLGGLAAGVRLALTPGAPAELLRPALQGISLGAILLWGLGLAINRRWLARLAAGTGAAASAAARLTDEFGLIVRLRLVLALGGMLAASLVLSPWGEGGGAMVAAFGLALASEALGRVLFYAARVRHGV